MSTEGRDGGGAPLNYPSLMRVAQAAEAGGDLPNALSFYRRAAEIEPSEPATYTAMGNVLLQMGSIDEAILAYNSALARNDEDGDAMKGLAKAYMRTGRPELATAPITKALEKNANQPKLLLLAGVINDVVGDHRIAQDWYRRGLSLVPGDPNLSLDLALSLALTGDYDGAIATLRPVVMSPAGAAPQRQTLALIYGLQGNRAEAARLGRIDLDEASVENNLSFYDTLRHLSPEARNRAITSASTELGGAPRS